MTKAIFFDFDGTLANTVDGIVLTMQGAFNELGLEVPTVEAVKQTIGIPLEKGILMLGGLGEYDENQVAACYRKLFMTVEVNHVSLFNGVPETLKTLASQNIRMAICTSRGYPSLEVIMSRHGLMDCFETCVTATDHLKPKPNPDMVLTLLDRMKVDRSEALVVGDTTYDIGMGNSAGCRTVAVTYGNQSREQLKTANPTYIIDDFSELLALV